jgi:hypothetical protein
MIDRSTILAARRLVNRKRATCADPNLKVMYETLSMNLLNLYEHPNEPDFLARLPENVRAIETGWIDNSAPREAER